MCELGYTCGDVDGADGDPVVIDGAGMVTNEEVFCVLVLLWVCSLSSYLPDFFYLMYFCSFFFLIWRLVIYVILPPSLRRKYLTDRRRVGENLVGIFGCALLVRLLLFLGVLKSFLLFGVCKA